MAEQEQSRLGRRRAQARAARRGRRVETAEARPEPGQALPRKAVKAAKKAAR